MAATNDVSQLNGFFKEIYSDKVRDLIPEGVVLYNEIPFSSEAKQTGNLYHQPVVLQMEHGFTYGGPDGSAFALEAAKAGVMKDAQVQGYEMVLRSNISVGAISRAGNDKKAFGSATKLVVQNMLRSFTRRMEIQLMYGQMGLAVVDSVASLVITMTAKSFAPGIWAGAEGMPIDIYDVTLATKRGTANVTAVSFDDLTITLDAMPAGVVATDVIFFKNAQGNEFAGVEKIIRNTGTLFNINAGSYNLWKGNVVGNSGTGRDPSFALIEKAITKSVEKGLADQDVLVVVNPEHWEKLLTEQAGKRLYDSSYSSEKMKNGSKEIEFYGQAGLIKVKPSIYCKRGHIFVLPIEEFSRVGSRDITFDQPGFEGQFIRMLTDSNGYELRAYTDQALFCSAPGHVTLLDDVEGA